MAKKWTVDEILDLARSFQGACVLTAAADLDVFSVLHQRKRAAAAVAGKIRANPRATAALLDALVALGLLTKRGARYGLAPGVAEAIGEASTGSVLPMVRHSGACLRNWAQLGEVVKTGRPARRLPSVRGAAADHAAFIGAMHVINAPFAAEVVASLGPPRFHRLLDVGGGSGTWTLAFLQAVPGATATLFDLPSVIPMARERVEAEGLSDRVTLVAGDYTRDKLPAGADLAWVSAIVHQESLAGTRALFRHVRAALVPGGRILVRDIVMHPSRTQPAMGALFAINMLVATEEGGTHTFAELARALEAAGFEHPKLVRHADDMSSVIRAVKPKAHR